MPRLRNVYAILDTATGKYMVNVGCGGRSRPGWGSEPNTYKEWQVKPRLDEAALNNHWATLVQEANLPRWPDYHDPDYTRLYEEFRNITVELRKKARETYTIPETWRIVPIVPSMAEVGVPAADWSESEHRYGRK